MLVNPSFLDLIRLSIRFSSAQIAEVNNNLLEVGEIKQQRHQITASMLSNIARGFGLIDSAQVGYVAVANLPMLFVSKCIALTDRIKSRDLFDLWWMTHKAALPLTTQSIFETIQQYRPHFPYEHVRHRLLDWKIPETDESFDMLVVEPITVETIRDSFRNDVNKLEMEIAAKVKSELDEGRANVMDCDGP